MTNKCPKCAKSVYAAESALANGETYHKSCLVCSAPNCRKKLDSLNLTTHDNVIYCKSCYGKNFGAAGYGYGGATNSEAPSPTILSPTVGGVRNSNGSLNSPKLGPDEKISKCPKCEKNVYFAEERLGPGNKKYHKICFTCTECSKSVDSTSMAEKDDILYCKSCHGKKFGPRGYGFGSGTAFLTTS